jgi:hypothetical protein
MKTAQKMKRRKARNSRGVTQGDFAATSGMQKISTYYDALP